MTNNFWKILRKPIIGLAPMDGITDWPTRQIQISVAKPDVIFTEFIGAEFMINKPEKLKRKISFSENERPIVAQIVGYMPDAFATTVKKIIEEGFDGIDLNLGCPARSIMHRGAGAALIGNFHDTAEIIENILRAIDENKSRGKIPFSVKTRINKDRDMTAKWFEFLTEFPLDAIIIHGRKPHQGLTGDVDWKELEFVSEIIKSKNILCIGNGGITSLEHGREMCEKHNLDGVLIGQAALGNPWIFREIKPEVAEILHIIKKHAELAWEFYGQRGFPSVIKHFKWYCKNFSGSKKLRAALLKTKTLQEVMSILSMFDCGANVCESLECTEN